MLDQPIDTSNEACAVVCMLVSNPQGSLRKDGDGWQKHVNDLIRALRDERNEMRMALQKVSSYLNDYTNEDDIDTIDEVVNAALAKAEERHMTPADKPAPRTTAALLNDLRQRRDNAAAIGDHGEALILNDRIKDLKEGRTSPMVERATTQFESALAERRATEAMREAAPELLAALKECAKFWEGTDSPLNAMAQEAIAKAEGRT